jgi:hypothetical protein
MYVINFNLKHLSQKVKKPTMVLKFTNMKYAPLMMFQLVLLVLYFIFVRYGGAKDFGVKGKIHTFTGIHMNMTVLGFRGTKIYEYFS